MKLLLKAALAGFIFLAETLNAQTTITLNPAKDNTLYQSAGGTLSNGKGDGLFTGKTNSNLIRRALLQFDVAGNLPANATITDVTLTLVVNKTPPGAAATNQSLHTLAEAWGEGASNAGGQEGGGTTAQTGDATWLHTFYNTATWSVAGGDFTTQSSASTAVSGNGTYTWSTAQMAADVQSWLTNASANHGWIVIGTETTTKTARRIVSRESTSAASRPKLSITYTVPACSEPVAVALATSASSICAGTQVTLTTTGDLNGATEWHLYSGSCGGTPVASNSSGVFEVSPASPTTYFVRGEGGCATASGCAEVAVSVTAVDNASFSYASQSFCQLDSDPTPAITGTAGGSFSGSPEGLAINAATGQIDVSASTPGVAYAVTYTTPGPACPSSLSTSITILTEYNENATKSICDGTSFTFGTKTLTAAGEYSEVFQSKSGCDSTVLLNLKVLAAYDVTAAASVCSGGSYSFGHLSLAEAGEYTNTFQSVHGCDSTVRLTLSVLPVQTSASEASICSGSSYSFGSRSLTVAGEYTEVFASKNGCDSTVVLKLTVYPAQFHCHGYRLPGRKLPVWYPNLNGRRQLCRKVYVGARVRLHRTLSLTVNSPDVSVNQSGGMAHSLCLTRGVSMD